MSIVIMILVALLVFGVVIFFHELGHFITAKKSGMKVNEFAIGMGPTILKFGKKETKYALRLLPVGGFVSVEGEDEESGDARSYQNVAVWKRVIFTIAGAFMNLLLGFLALILLTALGDEPIGGREIAQVQWEGSGLQVGDVIQSVNGRRMFIFSDIQYEFLRTQNGTITIEVKRGNERVTLTDITFPTEIAVDPTTGEEMINEATGEPYEYLVLGFKVWRVEKTFGSVIKEAFNTMLSYARLIYLTLFDLITGKVPINQLSGPVGIVSEIGRAVSMGWQPVVNLLAIISVNLGVMNMLPLPALDGGRTILLIIEGIRRKPIPKKYETVINVVGFGLLIALMLFVSFNDIVRLVT